MYFYSSILFFSWCVVTHSFQVNLYDMTWTKSNWKNFTTYQLPEYSSPQNVKLIQTQLEQKPPLIFVEEADRLQLDLIQVSKGHGFVLIAGDCAESMEDSQVQTIKDYCKIMLQLGILVTKRTGKKAVKIGRIAGQFAKPRSCEYEQVDGKRLLTYRGDIINDQSKSRRDPDPSRMLDAYVHSVGTLNLLRAFTKGGFASLHNIPQWYVKTIDFHLQKQLISDVMRDFHFWNGLGISVQSNRLLQDTNFFIGHECLLLPYEESFTRMDPKSLRYFSCSAHFLWIGERTRKIDSAQIEYIRGIHNPIGIKISHMYHEDELETIIKRVNPGNQVGKLVLMTRFGRKNIKKLNNLIEWVKEKNFNVIWICDPMHGNTYEKQGYKTRCIRDIQYEIDKFLFYHHRHQTLPGGIHLEMTPKNVSEVIEHRRDTINPLKYETKCDPRLNGTQSIMVMNYLLSRIKHYEQKEN